MISMNGRIFVRLLLLFVLVVCFSEWASAHSITAAASAKTTTPPQNYCPVLPKGIDLLHATKSEIEMYRLPPRPDDAIQIADWYMRVQRLRNNECAPFIPISPQHQPISQPHPTKPTGIFGQISYNNWAGYVVYDSGGITDAKGHWNVQCLGSQQQPGARETSWVGIGGNTNSNLIQTGTAYTRSGYQFFIQFVGYGGPSFATNNLPCGTSVDAEVYYISSYGGEWCTNMSSNVGAYTTCFDSSKRPSNSTAEWIDERPYCSNGFSKLADFNYTDYSNAYAQSISRGWHTIGGFGNDQITMQDGPILAQPQNLNTGTNSFRDNWRAVGYGVACANF